MNFKIIGALLCAFIACISPTISAPIPPGAEGSGLYFPIRVGAKWVYQEKGKESTLIVTDVEKESDEYHVTVGTESSSGKITLLQKMSVSKRGLVQSRIKADKADKSITLLKLSSRADLEWEYELPLEGAV